MITGGVNIGTQKHDIIGGEYLRHKGFPDLVCDIVAGHVKAKRYLVLIEDGYYENLSDASKKTLVHQGGTMSAKEANEFESSDTFDAIIRMRRWDELAKDTNVVHQPLYKYRHLCENVLSKNK
ncbi:PHNZ-like protein [Mya arenaria]|uniref:PHNZ-like protein n=2 Tax=Mya arenaria TaxID=6604 RepID=A0ABY7EHA6_MYAAR|nr:PHNZ-like protein [Mya arenaria]